VTIKRKFHDKNHTLFIQFLLENKKRDRKNSEQAAYHLTYARSIAVFVAITAQVG